MYIRQWLDAHDRLRGRKTALIDRVGGRRLTYSELNRAARGAGAWLQTEGVSRGDRVAVLALNSPEFLAIFLGCARIGAVCVPLNWRLSERELDGIVEDCDPQVRMADANYHRDGWMRLPALDELLAFPAVSEPSIDVQDAVAILYTGGTTGVPKGAILTHTTVQWNAWNTVAGWGLAPDDVAPIFTPMFHTGGLNVQLTPLLCLGGTVVLTGPFDPALALDTIEHESCTQLFLVPTMFQMLRESPAYRKERLRTVRQMISGGAPCPRSLFEQYWADGLPLRQGYGLTEAGPNNFGVTVEQTKARPGTIGRPLPYVEVRLLKEDGSEAAAGETGEVCIRGGHVMPGYWRRPAESAQALRNGWLHTGDLAWRDGDGFFYINGRLKEMFISGGENVFPAEVEEILAAHPAVAEAAVIGVPDERWGEVGRAYIVTRRGTLADPTQLIEYCRSHLARYKAPREVRVLDALPRSAAGKVLKHLLPQ